MDLPASMTTIDKRSIRSNKTHSPSLKDYFDPNENNADTNSQKTNPSKPKNRGTSKKNKHVIDKCGPFAAKGREESNLIMVGKNGLGVFAKKTEKSKATSETNSVMDKSVPTIQTAINHPKSAISNPQHFHQTQISKTKKPNIPKSKKGMGESDISSIPSLKLTSKTLSSRPISEIGGPNIESIIPDPTLHMNSNEMNII